METPLISSSYVKRESDAPTISNEQPKKLRTFFSALIEPVSAPVVDDPDPGFTNAELLPTPSDRRTFSLLDMLSFWLSVVVGVPTFYIAGSLVELGMSWWQGILTVIAANLLLLFPLILTGHAGTKYGIPFAVLSRASFGIRGAWIATLLRGLVACGWFGIETWIGGEAMFVLFNALLDGRLSNSSVQLLGASLWELACFAFFWLVQAALIWNGIEGIRKLEKYCAPVLLVLSAALLLWAYVTAGGFGPMLSASSEFGSGGEKEGQFWRVFIPALTANIGSWAALSVNITGRTQRLPIIGVKLLS